MRKPQYSTAESNSALDSADLFRTKQVDAIPFEERGFTKCEAAEIIGIARNTLDGLIRAGRLDVVCVGNRRIVTGRAIRKVLSPPS